MYVNPFQVSLETLIATSEMLGHRLEARGKVRDAQDRDLLRRLQEQSSALLPSPADQKHLFVVAPLDILVEDGPDGRRKYHIIEINGTGIGGLTNLTGEAVSRVLDGFREMAAEDAFGHEEPLILVASSGLESSAGGRRNKLLHEKILYMEALKRGFEERGRTPAMTTMARLAAHPGEVHAGGPAVVLGYMKEFLEHLECDELGTLRLFGRPVAAGVNDRFCLNVVHKFEGKVDLSRFLAVNRGFTAGADKGVAYQLLNEYLHRHPSAVAKPTMYARCATREDLIATVVSWVRQGVRAVIKPQGTGLGHGIEFFLDAEEPDDAIIARIDGSLRLTESFYGLAGGALPYTVCEFIDTRTVKHGDFAGHKYEIRVVVYRDGGRLKAFPSIVKVSSEAYNAENPSHMSLINNITASATATQTAGVEHMMSLCRRDTMQLLDIAEEEMAEVCSLATGFIRHVVEQVQTRPHRLGLAAAS